MALPGSRRWAYVRIMAGTILGGGLGFYVMHRIETSYKARRIPPPYREHDLAAHSIHTVSLEVSAMYFPHLRL
ncbi:hypothetical protein ACQ4PT_049594 [Festuca glaucescens]